MKDGSEWELEVIDQYGEITAFGQSFPTELDALEEALDIIEEDGIEWFSRGTVGPLH